MKILKKYAFLNCFLCQSVFAAIHDPVADYRSRDTENKGTLLKVTFDWNSDGKNEVFLSSKKDFDDAKDNSGKFFWSNYLANANLKYEYSEKEEIVVDDESVVGDGSPYFNPELCYVGEITEISKFGIVSIHIDNPKDGDPIAYIHAMVLTGDVFKDYLLAKYNAKGENALFDKYLKDDKRTQLTVEEVPAVVAEEDEQEDE